MAFLTSVRGTLVILVLATVLPLMALQAGTFYSRFEERRSHELGSSLEMARAVAGTFDAYVQDILRQELALGLAISSMGEIPSPQADALLTESAREYPSIRHYSWADPSGRILAFSLRESIGGDISDRPYFQEIVRGKPWAISDLTIGRFTGETAFIIARGIRDGRGTLKGVMMASVNPTMLGGSLAISRESGGAISIIDSQGIQVYRYPEIIVPLEERTHLRAEAISPFIVDGDEMTGIYLSSLDGRERMAGQAPIRSIGWTARASRPVDGIMAPLSRDLASNIGILLLLGFVTVGAAIIIGGRIVIPVSRLEEHAMALAQGNLTHRLEISGAREVVELARAFNLMADEIQLREERFRGAFEYAAIGVSLVGLDGRFLQVNRSFCEMLGYSETELLATTFEAITHPGDLELSVQQKEKLSAGIMPSYQLEKRYLHKDGHVVWVLLSVSAVRHTSRSVSYFIAQVQDITQRKHTEEERDRLQTALQELSLLDELTGLYNRRGFLALAQQQLRQADRNRQKVLLFFFDMNNLKQINDTHGHAEGDRSIVRMAQILRGTFRQADIVARMGGDEFAAMTISTDEPLVPIQNRLKRKTAEQNALGDLAHWISFSTGTAAYSPDDPQSLDELLAIADRAMYEEKRARRAGG